MSSLRISTMFGLNGEPVEPSMNIVAESCTERPVPSKTRPFISSIFFTMPSSPEFIIVHRLRSSGRQTGNPGTS